jgi:cytochrome o ubiquinol oxidase subunit 2
MAFEVRAVPSGDFDNWIAAARRAGPDLDPQSYAVLARQSANVAPFTYRSVGPRLFDAIATRGLPPGPGPDLGKPGATVSPRTGG